MRGMNLASSMIAPIRFITLGAVLSRESMAKDFLVVVSWVNVDEGCASVFV
jgi:hypothetical protein